MAKLLWELWQQRRQARPQRDPGLAVRVPPGQTLTTKWPVLTYGRIPRFDPERWTFRCFGLVEREVSWSWQEFLRLPRVTVTSDIHCVTHGSRCDAHGLLTSPASGGRLPCVAETMHREG